MWHLGIAIFPCTVFSTLLLIHSWEVWIKMHLMHMLQQIKKIIMKKSCSHHLWLIMNKQIRSDSIKYFLVHWFFFSFQVAFPIKYHILIKERLLIQKCSIVLILEQCNFAFAEQHEFWCKMGTYRTYFIFNEQLPLFRCEVVNCQVIFSGHCFAIITKLNIAN